MRRVDEGLRRLLDVAAAGIGLIVLSPLLAGLALWIRWSSPGPVLHCAERAGRGGKPFRLYKFRSMVVNAEELGPGITTRDDPRVTRGGRFLRQTKLDELPQLLNVLKGEMSLVGPRPEDVRFVQRYSPEQRRILDYKPGITSAASLQFRNEEELMKGDNWEEIYFEVLMPEKIRLDLAYLEKRTVVSDVGLIFKTIGELFG